MEDLTQKQPRARVLRVAEKLGRLAGLDNLSRIHEHDAIGQPWTRTCPFTVDCE